MGRAAVECRSKDYAIHNLVSSSTLLLQVLLEESAELVESAIPLQKCLQELCKPVVTATAKLDDALEVAEAIASTTKVLGKYSHIADNVVGYKLQVDSALLSWPCFHS